MRRLPVVISILLLAAGAFAQDNGGANLDRFVGTWAGYSSIGTGVAGSMDLTTGWMNVEVTRPGAEAVALKGDRWGISATLAWNPSSGSYSIGWTAESCPAISALKIAFGDGVFHAEETVPCDGGKCQVTATVSPDGAGSEWTLVTKRGDFNCRLRLALGKPE